MTTKTHILRTDKKGVFKVDKLLDNDERLIISLPHRVSFTLSRFDSIISLDCDLGLMSSETDFLRVCEINVFREGYPSAVKMDERFMSTARSFDNSFHVKKFIAAYTTGKYSNPISHYNVISPKVFGEEWLDQVFIHLAEPGYEKKIENIEFSVIRANYIDDEPLDEPSITLVGSLKLRSQKAHYFLFVEWWGDNFWSYQKNFFFNNTEFFRKEVNYAVCK